MSKLSIEEWFKKAISIRDNGDLEKAIQEFLEIINNYSNHPKISGVFIVLGGIYDDLDDRVNSMTYFKKASELNPKSELASLGLYLSYVKLREYDEAIKELKRYLNKYPAERYKTTLQELLDDLSHGYAKNFESTIIKLAKKHHLIKL